jgi:hypothetical protein
VQSGRLELFRVVVDNSGINQVVDQFESRLKQHDGQVEELFWLVNNHPTKGGIDKYRSEMAAAIQKARLGSDSNIKALEWN